MIFTYKEVTGLVPIWEVPSDRLLRIEPFTVFNTEGKPWIINSIELHKGHAGIVLHCYISKSADPIRICIEKTGRGGSYIRPQLPPYVRIMQ